MIGIRGNVSNLSNLGAQLGVIVIGKGNLDDLRKRPPWVGETAEQLEPILPDRVYRWVYAEAQPQGRIIVMFEDDVREWADKMVANESQTTPTTFDPKASSRVTPRVATTGP